MTKKIEAIIREEALQDVKEALREIGIVGMNVVEVHGHGRQGGIELSWRGTSDQPRRASSRRVSIREKCCAFSAGRVTTIASLGR